MKLCFYACTVFACIGYRGVSMHVAVLSSVAPIIGSVIGIGLIIRFLGSIGIGKFYR